ncbi:E2F/DP winged-helix DNA-binding domain family protein [Acanthocheilonema viteae]
MDPAQNKPEDHIFDMRQYPSTSESNSRLSKNHSTEDGVHCRSRRDEYIKNALRRKEERKKFFAGLDMFKSSLAPVFQNVEGFSLSKRLLVNENQPTLAAINSNVNSLIDDTRKRKALKIRNGVGESGQLIDRIKIKQNGNFVNKAHIQWALKEEISDKNWSGNKGNYDDESKWNGNVRNDQGNDEKSDVNRVETKRNRKILRDQGDADEPVVRESKIRRNRNIVIEQSNDGKKPEPEGKENEGKVDCDRNDLRNQNEAGKRDGNRDQQSGNEDQQIGSAPRQQIGTGESNNGFPRKTKTLGLLCRKFLLEVLDYVVCEDDKINLETIACSMKVEKRRIYDVVNVMEALGAMKKSHKSFYTWEGLDNLPSILYKLKIEAEEEAVYEKVVMTQHVMTRFMEVPNVNENANESPDGAGPSQTPDDNDISAAEQSNLSGNNDTGSVSSKQSGSKKKESKRQRGLNSLTYLCKYFFKILIAGLDYEPDYKVSLDVASTILIKDPEIDGCKPPDRSRCRRIYDVANVLISLGLIERRMFTFGTKKIPLFVYCGPKITENGKFDFFHHIRFNKLSAKLKNSEEKKAYEVEEENLETFFLKKNKRKQGTAESSSSVGEPVEKQSRIEGTNLPIQDNSDVEKENVPVTVTNHSIIPSSQNYASMPIIRPQPQKAADLTSVLASQTFLPFNDLQSAVQQSRLTQFMPLPIRSQEFLPFDPNMILLNNRNILQTSSQIPIQQNNFNYLPVAYPLSPMGFLQQSYGPAINNGNINYPAYNNINSNFIHPANTLRSSVFNIDSILGNRETRQSNQALDEIKLATSMIQHSNLSRDQNAPLQQPSNFLFNYSSVFHPNK